MKCFYLKELFEQKRGLLNCLLLFMALSWQTLQIYEKGMLKERN